MSRVSGTSVKNIYRYSHIDVSYIRHMIMISIGDVLIITPYDT